MNVILETDRLRLRRLTEADADLLFELDSDPRRGTSVRFAKHLTYTD